MKQPPHMAVCWEKGMETIGLALATYLRRAGQPTDFAFAGKPQKQFDRARRQGAIVIVTVNGEDSVRVWWSYRPTVDASIADFKSWFEWLNDDLDVLPEPPEHMLAADPWTTP